MKTINICMTQLNTLPFFFAGLLGALGKKCVLVDRTEGRLFKFLADDKRSGYPYDYNEYIRLVYSELDISEDAEWAVYVYTEEKDLKESGSMVFLTDSYLRNAKDLKGRFWQTLKDAESGSKKLIITDYIAGRYSERAIIRCLGREAEDMDTLIIPADERDKVCDLDLDVTHRLRLRRLSRPYRRVLVEIMEMEEPADVVLKKKLIKVLGCR